MAVCGLQALQKRCNIGQDCLSVESVAVQRCSDKVSRNPG